MYVDDIVRLNTLVLGAKGTFILNAGRGTEDDVKEGLAKTVEYFRDQKLKK